MIVLVQIAFICPIKYRFILLRSVLSMGMAIYLCIFIVLIRLIHLPNVM